MKDLLGDVLFTSRNTQEQVAGKFSAREMKDVADVFELPYQKNANCKIMAKILLEYARNVVDKLNED